MKKKNSSVDKEVDKDNYFSKNPIPDEYTDLTLGYKDDFQEDLLLARLEKFPIDKKWHNDRKSSSGYELIKKSDYAKKRKISREV